LFSIISLNNYTFVFLIIILKGIIMISPVCHSPSPVPEFTPAEAPQLPTASSVESKVDKVKVCIKDEQAPQKQHKWKYIPCTVCIVLATCAGIMAFFGVFGGFLAITILGMNSQGQVGSNSSGI
jgi:hypothetical protein